MNVFSVENPIVKVQIFLDIREDTMQKNFWMLWKFKKLGEIISTQVFFFRNEDKIKNMKWYRKDFFFSLLTEKIHWEIQKKKSSFTIIIVKEMVLCLETEILNNSGVNT